MFNNLTTHGTALNAHVRKLEQHTTTMSYHSQELKAANERLVNTQSELEEVKAKAEQTEAKLEWLGAMMQQLLRRQASSEKVQHANVTHAVAGVELREVTVVQVAHQPNRKPAPGQVGYLVRPSVAIERGRTLTIQTQAFDMSIHIISFDSSKPLILQANIAHAGIMSQFSSLIRGLWTR